MFYEWFFDLFNVCDFRTNEPIGKWKVSGITKIVFLEVVGGSVGIGLGDGHPDYFDTFLSADHPARAIIVGNMGAGRSEYFEMMAHAQKNMGMVVGVDRQFIGKDIEPFPILPMVYEMQPRCKTMDFVHFKPTKKEKNWKGKKYFGNRNRNR